jgi:replicative DNA helicase
LATNDFSLAHNLPANVEAERSILGAILLDNHAYNQAAEHLKAEDFSLDSHRRIYSRMVDLAESSRPIDMITLVEELERRKELEVVGDVGYLSRLLDGVPDRPSIEHYLRIVRDKALLRGLMHAANAAIARAAEQSDPAEDILNDAEAAIFQLSEKRIGRGFMGVQEIVKESFGSIDALLQRGQRITGLETHYGDLDEMTSGLQKSDLIIIAARPSMGKTAFALNIAENSALEDQKVVGIFSLEMSREALLLRLLCSRARVDSHKMRTGSLWKDDMNKVVRAMGDLAQASIFIDDTPGIGLGEMRAKARRLMQMQGKLDLIIVDYMQLMSGGGRRYENRTQEVSAISRGLKALAKELTVPLIALSQLSRAPESRGGDHRPQLADLRESGCLTGDTPVPVPSSGRDIPIRELAGRSGFEVWALNRRTLQLERALVSRAFPTGFKPVFCLRTRQGQAIRATANHPFCSPGGWQRLDRFCPGDPIALPLGVSAASARTIGEVGWAPFHPRRGEGCVLPDRILQFGRREETAEGQALARDPSSQAEPNQEVAGKTALAVASSQPGRSRGRETLERVEESMDGRVRFPAELFWDRVESITPAGVDEVFDLTVPGPHNFVAGDFIVHNSIEQDADVVAFIFREEIYKPDDPQLQGKAELIIAKQRNGPTGKVNLAFLKNLTRFESMLDAGLED